MALLKNKMSTAKPRIFVMPGEPLSPGNYKTVLSLFFRKEKFYAKQTRAKKISKTLTIPTGKRPYSRTPIKAAKLREISWTNMAKLYKSSVTYENHQKRTLRTIYAKVRMSGGTRNRFSNQNRAVRKLTHPDLPHPPGKPAGGGGGVERGTAVQSVESEQRDDTHLPFLCPSDLIIRLSKVRWRTKLT